ncbi:hypothetical protein SAMN05660862_0749 [Sphingobacterium psychroaquaticum]|uniref:Uncharacterized protein n=1 Tax=Sphingobacterium psychroaquaticum TaxID=561061 RepID=A0A1X7IG94_9SPHI|nr:hypothetical protein SAMN05660862_0749 [Sphingobacterium psychroaquaticum]
MFVTLTQCYSYTMRYEPHFLNGEITLYFAHEQHKTINQTQSKHENNKRNRT